MENFTVIFNFNKKLIIKKEVSNIRAAIYMYIFLYAGNTFSLLRALAQGVYGKTAAHRVYKQFNQNSHSLWVSRVSAICKLHNLCKIRSAATEPFGKVAKAKE